MPPPAPPTGNSQQKLNSQQNLQEKLNSQLQKQFLKFNEQILQDSSGNPVKQRNENNPRSLRKQNQGLSPKKKPSGSPPKLPPRQVSKVSPGAQIDYGCSNSTSISHSSAQMNVRNSNSTSKTHNDVSKPKKTPDDTPNLESPKYDVPNISNSSSPPDSPPPLPSSPPPLLGSPPPLLGSPPPLPSSPPPPLIDSTNIYSIEPFYDSQIGSYSSGSNTTSPRSISDNSSSTTNYQLTNFTNGNMISMQQSQMMVPIIPMQSGTSSKSSRNSIEGSNNSSENVSPRNIISQNDVQSIFSQNLRKNSSVPIFSNPDEETKTATIRGRVKSSRPSSLSLNLSFESSNSSRSSNSSSGNQSAKTKFMSRLPNPKLSSFDPQLSKQRSLSPETLSKNPYDLDTKSRDPYDPETPSENPYDHIYEELRSIPSSRTDLSKIHTKVHRLTRSHYASQPSLLVASTNNEFVCGNNNHEVNNEIESREKNNRRNGHFLSNTKSVQPFVGNYIKRGKYLIFKK